MSKLVTSNEVENSQDVSNHNIQMFLENMAKRKPVTGISANCLFSSMVALESNRGNRFTIFRN